jgi:hypothetical protein
VSAFTATVQIHQLTIASTPNHFSLSRLQFCKNSQHLTSEQLGSFCGRRQPRMAPCRTSPQGGSRLSAPLRGVLSSRQLLSFLRFTPMFIPSVRPWFAAFVHPDEPLLTVHETEQTLCTKNTLRDAEFQLSLRMRDNIHQLETGS